MKNMIPPTAAAISSAVARSGSSVITRPPLGPLLRWRWRGSARQAACIGGGAGGADADAMASSRPLSAARSSSAVVIRWRGSGSSARQIARSRCAGTSGRRRRTGIGPVWAARSWVPVAARGVVPVSISYTTTARA